MHKKNYKNKQGSALLIAILVMGVLVILTLGLSDLVIREIYQTKNTVASGQAYFSAEAGIENGLLDLHENLPGFEKNSVVGTQADQFNYDYKILNTAERIPTFDQDKLVFLSPEGKVISESENAHSVSSNVIYEDFPESTYKVLHLNETVIIPLSNDLDGDSVTQDVQNFLVEYYFEPNKDGQMGFFDIPNNFNNLDILRWKIYGYPNFPFDSSETHAISDFYPALFGTDAVQPSCIGTKQDLHNCIGPATFDKDETLIWSAARECYLSDAGVSSASALDPSENNCTIKDFINSHTQNYLVLTNVAPPKLLDISDAQNPEISLERANIYYRIIAAANGPKLVREAAVIESSAYALNGKVKEGIKVNIPLGSFLPVFNFSLYRTETD